jgi:hypothetical protein
LAAIVTADATAGWSGGRFGDLVVGGFDKFRNHRFGVDLSLKPNRSKL